MPLDPGLGIVVDALGDVEFGGQHCFGHPVAVAVESLGDLGGARDVAHDPVGDLEPRVLACLLDQPHDVSGDALGRELRSDFDVELDENRVAG